MRRGRAAPLPRGGKRDIKIRRRRARGAAFPVPPPGTEFGWGLSMNIVVLAGGLSPERDVSLSSGAKIAAALRARGTASACWICFSAWRACRTTRFRSLRRSSRPWRRPSARPRRTLPPCAPRAGRGLSGSIGAGGVIELCRAADVTFSRCTAATARTEIAGAVRPARHPLHRQRLARVRAGHAQMGRAAAVRGRGRARAARGAAARRRDGLRHPAAVRGEALLRRLVHRRGHRAHAGGIPRGAAGRVPL